MGYAKAIQSHIFLVLHVYEIQTPAAGPRRIYRVGSFFVDDVRFVLLQKHYIGPDQDQQDRVK